MKALIVCRGLAEKEKQAMTKKKIVETAEPAKRMVIITTVHRGVFYGELVEDNGKSDVTLANARNVIYWSGKRGFMGLASHGPESESKIGSTAIKIKLYDISAVIDCEKEAVDCFAKWPEP